METVEYRCVLVRPRSHAVLAIADPDGYCLPRVLIPRATRPAQEVQRAIEAKLALNIFVLEIWASADGLGFCAVAEVLTDEMPSPLEEVPVEKLGSAELFEGESRRLEQLFGGMPRSPISYLGWIDEAIAWMESATNRPISPSRNIEQWNAGGGFTLFRVCARDDRYFWVKATGKPNAHEFGLIRLLSELCPEFLPKVVATRKDWNAWLSEDAGAPLPEPAGSNELAAAATTMARLQVLTIGRSDELLTAGAFDQRLPALRNSVDRAIAYLIEAMAQQTSTKAAPISGDRLKELGTILRDACFRLEALNIPDTLIHNDLNAGNVLWDGVNCVFTDWSEAAVGNPFLSCERLCQLNPAHSESVRTGYRNPWAHLVKAETLDKAIALAPLLTIYAYLYGRGDWLGTRPGDHPEFDSYARSLARHMDRAAKDFSLPEVLCH
jgi:hypothetical protein